MTSFECYKCFYKTNKKNNIIYHFNRKNKCIRSNNCSYTDNEIILLNNKQLIENMETNLEDFIIKKSNIPKTFLKDFFNLGGDSYGDTYKNINFDDVVKWLEVQKNNLKRILTANFKIIDDYTEDKILVKNKNRGANYVSKIMLTPDCFKELCMLSQTEKAKGVQKYYIVVEGLLKDNFYGKIINNLNKELGIM